MSAPTGPTVGRYRRKPTEIEAVEFDPRDFGTRIEDAPQGARIAVRDTVLFLRARGPAYDLAYEVWNDKHSSWIGVKPGDFLRVDTPGDVYPIDRETFEATYEPMQGEGG